MRAPQPAAGLHTCVVPSWWFAHYVDRTRNRHALALDRGQEDTCAGMLASSSVNRHDHGSSRRLQSQESRLSYCDPSHSGHYAAFLQVNKSAAEMNALFNQCCAEASACSAATTRLNGWHGLGM